jgi:hypothetical protein
MGTSGHSAHHGAGTQRTNTLLLISSVLIKLIANFSLDVRGSESETDH